MRRDQGMVLMTTLWWLNLLLGLLSVVVLQAEVSRRACQRHAVAQQALHAAETALLAGERAWPAAQAGTLQGACVSHYHSHWLVSARCPQHFYVIAAEGVCAGIQVRLQLTRAMPVNPQLPRDCAVSPQWRDWQQLI